MQTLATLWRLVRWLTAIAAFLLFTACSGGGGGGGGSSSDDGFTVSATSLNFNAIQNTALPPVQDIQTSFTNPEAYYIGAAYPPGVSPVSWLTITYSGSGNSYTFHFSVNTTNLSPGTYTTTISLGIVRSDGSVITYKNVDISYTVATVSASPTYINFNASTATTPVPKNLELAMSAGSSGWTSAISYTNGTPGWLNLSPASGSLLPANITVSASSMPAGVYRAEVNFSVDGVSITVPVSLTVNAARVNFVAPYVATTNVGGNVIIRGYGFSVVTNPEVRFGTTAATVVNVVSDSEIRATHPALPKGNYPVTVQNATQSLPTRAQLVVVDPPSYSYAAISRSAPMPNGIGNNNLIYDAERQAIYLCDPDNDRVERYRFNGTNWLTDPVISIGTRAAFGGIVLSPDGKEILRMKFRSIAHIDPVGWSVTADVSSDPVLGVGTNLNLMAMANDGAVVGNANVQSVSYLMYKYDSLLREFFRLAVPSGMADFYNINRSLSSSADGSKLLLVSLDSLVPIYSYNSSDGNFVTTPVSASAPYGMSTDRTGSRAIISTGFNGYSVYDAQFNVLGALPQVNAIVISPDGTKAYTYVSSTGMVHVYDLNSSNGSGGFAEIGAGTSVPDSLGPGYQMAMTVSPDGQSLFIAGYQRVIILPAP